MRLEAERLSVTPPGAAEPAVRDCSLSLLPGEWVGLAGPNGSGKTSLLLGLAGLWPSTGELRLDGVPFGYGGHPIARRRIGLIQQDPSSQLLQPTVRDELAFGLRNLGAAAGEVAERIGVLRERLRLGAEWERDPSHLSAGRQQMVLLGAALAPSPALLLADEATAHMDAPSRRLALEVLRGESAAGLSIVWASQNPDELSATSRVVELGPRPEASIAPEPTPPIDSGPARLRVRVEPLDPLVPIEGPQVRTDLPLRIEIGQRGLLALTGPNGAGKSVILAAICGFAGSPQIALEWQQVPEIPPIAALQFPELQIFQELVSDEIAYASVSRGRPAGETIEQASNWLQRLGFEPGEFLARRTWTLGQGMKRITEVIAALVTPASLYVLDEPTAGLDPVRRAALGRLLSERGREQPILVATQDRDWLAAAGIPAIEIGKTTWQMLETD